MTGKPIYEPRLDETFYSILENTFIEAEMSNGPVTTKIEGVTVEVQPSTSVEAALDAYCDAFDKSMKVDGYPEGADIGDEDGDSIESDKQALRQHLQSLPTAISFGSAAVVKWLGEWADKWSGYKTYDYEEMAKDLKNAGYQANARLGDSNITTRPEVYAEWVIGQAIRRLEEGKPIHPVFALLAEDYQKLAPEAKPQVVIGTNTTHGTLTLRGNIMGFPPSN